MASGTSIHLSLAFMTTNISLDLMPPSSCSEALRNSYRPFMPSVGHDFGDDVVAAR